jgi:Protein of unknown function (DUF3631)/Domain of unknown function (DUF3854)
MENLTRSLLDSHREHLRKSGLTDATIDAAGIFSVTDPAEAARLLKWKGNDGPSPAIAFPVHGFDESLTQTGLRPDTPRTRDDGSIAKYEQPLGEPHRVWFPPSALVSRELVTDLAQPLILVEGIKKALAAIQAGGAALSMQGVSVWHDAEHRAANKGKPTEWRLHRDFVSIPPRSRRVYIAFDGGDTTENPHVILAEARLARMLIDAGADVRLIRIPFAEGGKKVGLDDYLAALPESERSTALEALQRAAIPADPLERVDSALGADDPERAAAALLHDLSFPAAIRCADRTVDNIARKRLRSAGLLRDAFYEAAARFSASLGSLGDEATGEKPGLLFEDPAPAAEAQDTGAIFGELRRVFTRHVALPPGAAVVLALWTMSTWVLESAEFTARLALISPTKRCGKTRVLGLLLLVCRRGLVTANISAAALFRAVESARPTLLIDEADSYLTEAEDLRGVLNAGYRFDGAVVRCVGDEHEPTKFSCFAPAAIAAIGHLPGTIADRSIPIRMERKPAGLKLARIDREARLAIGALAPRLARWAADTIDALREARPRMPDALNDREVEISEPLLAIADAAGIADEAREALRLLFGASEGEAEDRNGRLLAAVWGLFNPAAEEPGEAPPKPPDFLPLRQIVESLNGDEAASWNTAARGKPITTGHLSRWLGAYGLVSRQSREVPGRPRGYFREDLARVAERYVGARPNTSRDGVTGHVPQAKGDDTEGVTPSAPSRPEDHKNLNDFEGRHAVTPGNGSGPGACPRCGPRSVAFLVMDDGGRVCGRCGGAPDDQAGDTSDGARQ